MQFVDARRRIKVLASSIESSTLATDLVNGQIRVTYIYKNDDSLLSLRGIIMLIRYKNSPSALFRRD